MNFNVKITTEHKNDYVVLMIEGSLSVENLSRFETSLDQMFREKKHIVINLKEVSFIDSSSLGVLILFFSKMEKIKKYMIFIHINQEISQMFQVAGLRNRLHIFNSLERAEEFIANPETDQK